MTERSESEWYTYIRDYHNIKIKLRELKDTISEEGHSRLQSMLQKSGVGSDMEKLAFSLINELYETKYERRE